MQQIAKETFETKGYLAAIFKLLQLGVCLLEAENIVDKLRAKRIAEQESVQ